MDASDDIAEIDLPVMEEIIIIEGANDSNSSQNAPEYDALASLDDGELNPPGIPQPNEHVEIQQEVLEVKPNLVPLYDLHTKNICDIISLLEDPIEVPEKEREEFGDDLVMTYDKGMQFKPFAATADGLTKRETPDYISGMIPFNESVNKSFHRYLDMESSECIV